MTRIVLTGSECTGKTTLAASLAMHYGVPWLGEYSREYASSHPALSAADVEPIAGAQLARDRYASRISGLIVQDTDLLSTIVYARHYYGFAPSWAVAFLQQSSADLYLLLDIDLPWIADDVRDRGDRREEMQALFVGALRELGVRWATIRGTGDARRDAAIAAIAHI